MARTKGAAIAAVFFALFVLFAPPTEPLQPAMVTAAAHP